MTDPCTAPGADWPCLALARRADPGRRLPVHLGEGPAAPRLGSVDRDHLDLLHQAPSLCRVEADAVVLLPPGGQALGQGVELRHPCRARAQADPDAGGGAGMDEFQRRGQCGVQVVGPVLQITPAGQRRGWQDRGGPCRWFVAHGRAPC